MGSRHRGGFWRVRVALLTFVVCVGAIVAATPQALAAPAQGDDSAAAEPEPLDLDRDQEELAEAVDEAERIAEEEAAARGTELPPGALDGTAGPDLFGGEDPAVLRPSTEGGAVYPQATDTGSIAAEPVDIGVVDDGSEPLSPEELTAGLQATSESLAEGGEVGALVDEARQVDVSDLEPGEEVVALRTVDSRTFLEEDGRFRTELGSEPMFATDPLTGDLIEPDTTLAGSRDGRWRPAAALPGTSFGPTAGDRRLGSMALEPGRSISWSLDGAERAPGRHRGDAVVYEDVLDNVDVELEAMLTGAKETIVIHDASAPSVYEFPLELTGLDAELDNPYGSIVLKDVDTGEPLGAIPSAWAVDSSQGPNGETPDPTPVAYELVGEGADVVLRVTVDATWLGDPARVFPVRVDPTPVSFDTTGDSWVHSASPNTNFSLTTSYSNEAVLKTGGGGGKHRTYFARWDLGWLASASIIEARYGSRNSYSYSCEPRQFQVYRVTSDWNESTVTWNSQPSFGELVGAHDGSYGYNGSCPANYFYTPATDLVQRWVDGTWPAYGVTGRVHANDAYDDSYTYKEFLSGEVGGQVLQVTWSPWRVRYGVGSSLTPPTVTQAGSIVIKVTNLAPTTWWATGGNRYRLGYHVYNSNGTLRTWEGGRVNLPKDVAWGETVAVTVPISALPIGNYQIRFDMLQEGVRWFSEEGTRPNSTYHPDLAPLGIGVPVGNVPPGITAASPAGQVETRTPTLSVTGVNPDNYPSASVEYNFKICEDQAMTAGCQTTAWTSSNRWSPPNLGWGTTYWWNAAVRETGTGALTVEPTWKAPLAPTLVQPSPENHFGSDPYAPADGGVNPSIGNYVTKSTDVQIAAAGVPLELTRTYNSMDTRVGAFGTGWSTLLDFVATPESGGRLLVSFADGHDERYGQNADGTWASPPGNTSIVRSVADGWELERPDRTVYVINAAGQLSGMRDAYGHLLTLTRVDGLVTQVTSQPSGRYMDLEWDAVGPGGAEVITAAQTNSADIDDPAEPAPRWTYSYTGGRLTEVCAPGEPLTGSQCTTHTYHPSGRGAEGKLQSVTRPEGNTSATVTYATDGTVATVTNGTGDTWTYSDADASAEGTYHPIAGFRGLNDTTVNAGATQVVDVTGAGGIPATGVQAVVVDIEVASFASGYVRAFASGEPEPEGVSTMLIVPGYRSTSATVEVGEDGNIAISNRGAQGVVMNVDVVGWYGKAGVSGGSVFVPVPTTRILDTRLAEQGPALAAGGTRSVQVTGAAGVPDDGVTAVVFDLEMVGASAMTRLVSYASGTTRPSISTAETGGGQVDNLQISAVGSDGKVAIYNSSSAVHILVDVVGYYADPALHDGNVYRPHVERLLDTRRTDGQWTTPWPAATSRSIAVAGEGALPPQGVAAVVGDVEGLAPSGDNPMRTGPSGAANGGTTVIAQSGLNAGNQIYAGVGDNGAIDLHSTSSNHVVFDVAGYFTRLPRTSFVEDPRGNTVEYRYDDLGRLVSRTDEAGYSAAWAYNEAGFVSSAGDESGEGRVFAYDEDGHVIADTLVRFYARWDSPVREWQSTTHYGYIDEPANPARDGKLAWVADGRSADADDTTYRTTYSYNDLGLPTSVIGPPLSAGGAGVGVTKTYTDGATVFPACPTTFGLPPAGLVATEIDAAGLTTAYCYDAAGDLREVQHPSGLLERFSYDDLGRRRTRSEVSDSAGSVTTTYSYDIQGRVMRELGDEVTSLVANPPGGPAHRRDVHTTYTPNGNIDRITTADLVTGDERWVDYSNATHGYDGADRPTGSVDQADRTTARTYDANGNLATETGIDGQTLSYAYDPRNLVRKVTAKNVVDDPIGAPSTTRDVILGQSYYDQKGREFLQFNADGEGLLARWSPTGQVEYSVARFHQDGDPATGVPSGPDRSALVAGAQYDRAGNPVRTFAPSNVAHIDEFAGEALGSDWQTTGSWSVSGGALTSSAAGELAWRQGASDGQVGLVVGASPTLSVLFRVQDAANYFKVEWEATNNLRAYMVTNGVADEFEANYGGTLAEGARLDVVFTGDRLRVFRSGTMVMETTLPADTAGTGVGVTSLAAGQNTSRFRFDAYTRTENAFDAYGRQISSTVDPLGANLRTDWDRAPDGRPLSERLSSPANPGQVAETRFGYSPTTGWLTSTDEVISRTVTGTPTPEDPDGTVVSEDLAQTSYTYDQRGLVTQVVSPEGGHVTYTYDQLGQLAQETGPARTVEMYGQPEQPGVRPTVSYAYNVFGQPVVIEDPAGRQTTVELDARGLPVTANLPAYTPPGGGAPVERTVHAEFDAAGRMTSLTDPLGEVRRFTYNTLGLLVAREDPAVGSDSAGMSRWIYDDAGRLVQQTDPTGAIVQQRWDDLGRQTAVVEHVRQPTPTSYVTAMTVGDGGGTLRTRSPEGVVTTTAYDLAGRISATADADGNTTTFGYDGLGRADVVTAPDGRKVVTTYDLVGNATGEAFYSAGGGLLGQTANTYDKEGRPLSEASPRGVAEGHQIDYAYDDAGQLTQRTTPVAAGQPSIIETWGYDAVGNATRYTDGRQNSTWQTYNSMGLPEDAIEPAAGPHTAEADRRWRTVYDAGGRPTVQAAPGGISVTSAWDELGRLVEQAGTGAQAATSTRTFDYDAAGRMTTASTPAGSQTFSWDDRGLVLGSQGVAGESSLSYDGDGRIAGRVDSSGTTQFTYDNRGLPDTMVSSLTGTASYDFDVVGRPETVDYGDGTTRTFTYDEWGRVDTDQLATGATLLYGADYGYDIDGNITSKAVSGTDVPAAGVNQYAYDRASRLTSWTNPAGGVESYGWDAASNRTQAGATTATYDEQNRLARTEGPGGLMTNTWAADGTLDTQKVQRRVTLVVRDPASLTPGEAVLAWSTVAAGHALTVIDDAAAAPTSGVDVIVISPSVDPAAIADRYRDVPLPVVNLAAGTWVTSGLTSAAPANASSASAYVAAPEHAVATGQTGQVGVLTSADTLSSVPPGALGSGAVTVWTLTAALADVVVATYETGSATPTGVATERRVAVGMSDAALTKLTAGGGALIGAATDWADDNGAVFGTTNFDFDAFEQLSKITEPGGAVTDHSYDPLGRRLTSPTGALSYAGTAIRPSSDGASRYQFGPVGTAAVDDLTAGAGQWAHLDGHSDVVAGFVPGATTLTSAQSFSPWGQPLGASGVPLPLGFQSERQDLPGGLIGMGVREYDPGTGSFASHDPANDPAVTNGYSYTSANPLSHIDPTGTWQENIGCPANCSVTATIISAVTGSATYTVATGVGAVLAEILLATAALAIAFLVACSWFESCVAAVRDTLRDLDIQIKLVSPPAAYDLTDIDFLVYITPNTASPAQAVSASCEQLAVYFGDDPGACRSGGPRRGPRRGDPDPRGNPDNKCNPTCTSPDEIGNHPPPDKTDSETNINETGCANGDRGVPCGSGIPVPNTDVPIGPTADPLPPVPDIDIDRPGDSNDPGPANIPDLDSTRRVGDGECGFSKGVGDVGWGQVADVTWDADSGGGCGGGGGRPSADADSDTPGQLLNGAGQAYPEVPDPRTGLPIADPPSGLSRVPVSERVPWGRQERAAFIKQWYDQGFDTPLGGWADYDIHHIVPREYGGTNAFENLVPVKRTVHQQQFNAWWRDY